MSEYILIPIADINGEVGPPGANGYNATNAAEDAEALAAFVRGDAGPNPFRTALITSMAEAIGTDGDPIRDAILALIGDQA